MLVTTNSSISSVSQAIAGNGNQATTKAKNAGTTSPAVSGSPKKSNQISTLAQQLSGSALRAEARYCSLSRKELGARAEELLGQILGPNYQANKARDDSGSFTVNERRAAYYEATEQRQAWKREVVAKAMAEYNRTVKMTNFYTEVLAYYKSLPPIEQAQLPANYEMDLQQRIANDTDQRPQAVQSLDLFSLFAMLDRLNNDEPESK